MINFDSKEEVEKFDTGRVLETIRRIPNQIEQTWNEIGAFDIPKNCTLAKNVVISGMGGSALGGRIIDSLIAERARTPIEVFNEYHIPNYVNQDTLVIISSYSGDTEETISDFYDALNKKAKVFGITTGGKLKNLLEENNLPSYIFNPKENPSVQPRFGLGYSVASILALLSRCGFIYTLNEEMEKVIEELKKYCSDLDVENPQQTNIAKKMSEKIRNTIPVIVASEHLFGSAHAFKNILNETAKSMSVLFDIPELNHHLMEGLKFPAKAKELLNFLFIESDLYNARVKKRYPFTQEVVEKNNISYISYKTRLETKLMQAFEIMILGCFTAFYLALYYEVDPKTIPWVDYFKEKMGQ